MELNGVVKESSRVRREQMKAGLQSHLGPGLRRLVTQAHSILPLNPTLRCALVRKAHTFIPADAIGNYLNHIVAK